MIQTYVEHKDTKTISIVVHDDEWHHQYSFELVAPNPPLPQIGTFEYSSGHDYRKRATIVAEFIGALLSEPETAKRLQKLLPPHAEVGETPPT